MCFFFTYPRRLAAIALLIPLELQFHQIYQNSVPMAPVQHGLCHASSGVGFRRMKRSTSACLRVAQGPSLLRPRPPRTT